ncbi:hypothetical protein ACFOPQ_04370 [Deinococcus antarcticus]|uniref:PEP-CTERM protein-sorting domain-containing protein n=1 Tax=Deinococcus antarcticus TaxID=1298767 RepID=A0ABV8A2T3_9DEIO
MTDPPWRVWLTTVLVCGWGILTIRAFQKQEWPFVLLCGLMFLVNVVTLWRLTRNRP